MRKSIAIASAAAAAALALALAGCAATVPSDTPKKGDVSVGDTEVIDLGEGLGLAVVHLTWTNTTSVESSFDSLLATEATRVSDGWTLDEIGYIASDPLVDTYIAGGKTDEYEAAVKLAGNAHREVGPGESQEIALIYTTRSEDPIEELDLTIVPVDSCGAPSRELDAVVLDAHGIKIG